MAWGTLVGLSIVHNCRAPDVMCIVLCFVTIFRLGIHRSVVIHSHHIGSVSIFVRTLARALDYVLLSIARTKTVCD